MPPSTSPASSTCKFGPCVMRCASARMPRPARLIMLGDGQPSGIVPKTAELHLIFCTQSWQRAAFTYFDYSSRGLNLPALPSSFSRRY